MPEFALVFAIPKKVHEDWAKYYPRDEQYEEYKNCTSKLTAKQNSYYISSCFFSQVNTKGSVYLNTTNNAIKFLIDTTAFNNCSNNEEGGCIFYQKEGEFVQDRVCSFASKVNSEFTFAVYGEIYVSYNSSYKNYIHDSSISKSGDESFNGTVNLYLLNGQVEIKSINISFSKISHGDFYQVESFSNGSNCSFSTFANSTNGVNGHDKFAHYHCDDAFEIRYCNILNNIGNIIYANYAEVYIKNCSFIDNDPRYFYFEGIITVDGCFINTNSQKIDEDVTYINTIEIEFIHNLPHFSSAVCETYIPIINDVKENTQQSLIIDLICILPTPLIISLKP